MLPLFRTQHAETQLISLHQEDIQMTETDTNALYQDLTRTISLLEDLPAPDFIMNEIGSSYNSRWYNRDYRAVLADLNAICEYISENIEVELLDNLDAYQEQLEDMIAKTLEDDENDLWERDEVVAVAFHSVAVREPLNDENVRPLLRSVNKSLALLHDLGNKLLEDDKRTKKTGC
jgi:hypothetical protein